MNGRAFTGINMITIQIAAVFVHTSTPLHGQLSRNASLPRENFIVIPTLFARLMPWPTLALWWSHSVMSDVVNTMAMIAISHHDRANVHSFVSDAVSGKT